MMKSLIIKIAAVGSGSLQSWLEKSPLSDCIQAFAKGDALASRTGRGMMLVLLFLFSTFYARAQTHPQYIPILTFDSFERFLKPTSDTVYVINFWATWCKPCVEELPAFEKLNENYKDKKVKVLLVSIDFRSQYEKKVVPFVQKNKLKSAVMLLDAEGNNDFIDNVNPAWQGTIPATTLIQATSNTNQFFEKQFTFEELENLVKPLIKL